MEFNFFIVIFLDPDPDPVRIHNADNIRTVPWWEKKIVLYILWNSKLVAEDISHLVLLSLPRKSVGDRYLPTIQIFGRYLLGCIGDFAGKG